ncbi:retron Ec78 anti-phage system effector HNH endonuclease PtuB [Roseateles sp.]|uniref:retron Ec78 anti-phage system effector HNH endonuclease PtuB n=1 Tax=Roseateles sp. TaxID=1971397 RepID=UPI00286C099F|nr:retron Ec78 anti-phage system effector HNH endonuclease PtuB [Roseateles sp.]
MHKLHRGEPPTCLRGYRHGLNNWSEVSQFDKNSIWDELLAMQGDRCAYCEARIAPDRRHIEHFRQKGRDPTVTFVWSNLFGSCNRSCSCGRHKDCAEPYAPADLIKPDEEDPEDYLLFSPDGTVSPKNGLSDKSDHRAAETIRLFNLNGPLRQIRFTELVGYKQTAEYFAELSHQFSEDEWLPLLQEELQATAQLPFSTAIKHMMTPQSPGR